MVAMDIDKQQKRKKTETRQELQKSDEIRFHTGVYEGKVGWFDASKLKTGSRVAVIVDMGQGVLKKTTVSAWSVTQRLPIKPPSFAHALVSQKRDIDKLIMKLAKQVALCGGTKSNKQLDSILDYIFGGLEHAEKVRKATHESVNFDD
jgi:hypothetical protein